MQTAILQVLQFKGDNHKLLIPKHLQAADEIGRANCCG
jgi:hypothetical protein